MSGRFVRASKFRHVFGQPTKKEQCYDNIRISKNAWDTNLIKANPKYLSVNWEASGGGAFAVIPTNERGRLPERIPLFRGHTAAVLDTDWSPFDDSLVVSGSDDGKVFVWKVPDGFTLYSDDEDPQDVAPIGKLSGHTRKVGHIIFNPAASGVVASSSGDFTIKIWDLEKGRAPHTLKHTDIVQSASWSANGSLLVSTCRDKKLRIWDVRQEQPAQTVQGHPGAKNSRTVWMGDGDRIATTGFSKMSDRQLGLWDIKNPTQPVGGFMILDSISGVCMPFWDDGTKMLYLAGKGDGNIRYYEYQSDKFEYLSEYKAPDPQRGIAFLPKRGVDVHENELMRAYKTVNDTYVEPISFIVPRRAEVFQEDVFPPAVGVKPAMSSSEWFSGKEGLPPKISMQSIYEGEEPKEVAADYKPPTSAPAPVQPSPAKAMPKEPEPEPVKSAVAAREARGAPPSMKDVNSSMANMVDKFADKDQAQSSEDDASSFEEVPKPVERPSTTTRVEEKTRGPPITKAPTESESKPVAAEPAPTAQPKPAPSADLSSARTPSSANGPSSLTPGAAAEGLNGHLQEIKTLLEAQKKQMSTQTDQISYLTHEVERLKGNVSGGNSNREKDERIRQLELELEEARS